ncbi:MAG: hypothetical protein K6E37_01425 [Bacteroidales bacterium]|nr:hypothetical protein [Bacteroidales bacterium]
MKKLIATAILLCIAALNVLADDIITKINGDVIKAKVIEISDNSVRFRRMDNPNGPDYVLPLSEIRSISYENGIVEEYSEPLSEWHNYHADSRNVRYRDINSVYDPRQYKAKFDDPFVPAISGIASFLIPGLGQCIDNEWGRGLGIFTANVCFSILETTEASLMFYAAADGSTYYRDNGMSSVKSNALLGASFCAALITATAHLAFNIWNICDAVNIAKVKNMYYQDLHFTPQIAFVPSVGSTGLQPTAGISMTLSF